ncbi:MAG: NAD-dependent dehydrogenase subunit [Gemmatimonadetes bacterium]|jgi:hydrogenase-4 component E|nr:NAD-dependent dehydrogenase subunit [Gemmatimonadota bacterium]
MSDLHELLLLGVVLTNFWVLGTTRLSSAIRATAIQGALLAALPVALHPGWSLHIIGLAVGTLLVKAILLPTFLSWAIREAAVRREIEPLIGFSGSLLLGTIVVALSFGIAQRIPLPESESALLIPVALATVMIGLIVLTTRNKALTQVVGYLILENGIYVFGLSQAERVPFLVELGVLLDIFVGIFIMGIVVFHINRAFDSMDSTRLTELKD